MAVFIRVVIRLSRGFRLRRSMTWICYEHVFCVVVALTDLFNEQERKTTVSLEIDSAGDVYAWLSYFQNSVDFLRPDE